MWRSRAGLLRCGGVALAVVVTLASMAWRWTAARTLAVAPVQSINESDEKKRFGCFNEQELSVMPNTPDVQATRFKFEVIRNVTRFNATLPICGCLRLDDAFDTPCTSRSRCLDSQKSNTKIEWLLLMGDSTVRQFMQNIIFAVNRAQVTNVQLWINGQSTLATKELTWSTILNVDLLFLDSPKILVSFRQLLTLTSSKSLALLRYPHMYALTRSYDDESVIEDEPAWRHVDLFPILDEPFFELRRWPLESFSLVSTSELSLLEHCGPTLVLVSSGLWESPNWSPTLERKRCGLSNTPADIQRLLFERRIRTVMAEACQQYGKDGFVWRTSVVPLSRRYPAVRLNSQFPSIVKYNSIAMEWAKRRGVPVLDYAELHSSLGDVSLDLVHPIDYVAAHGLAALLHHANRTRPGSALPSVLLPLISNHIRGLQREWDLGSNESDWMRITATDADRVRGLYNASFNRPLKEADFAGVIFEGRR